MYSTWHIYGYGVETSKIKQDEITVEKIEKLLSLAPEFQKEIHDFFEECEIETPCVEDYLEYDQDYGHGIAFILNAVIKETEGIYLVSCDDCNCNKFLLYPKGYPWKMNETDLKLNPEVLKALFTKYLSIICDTLPDIDYQECENGG